MSRFERACHPRRVGIFDRFRRWTLSGVERPWGNEPSIHRAVQKGIDPATGKLRADSTELPDSPEPDPDAVAWAPGALDGVLGHHTPGEDEEIRARQLHAALERLLAAPTLAHFRKFYELVSDATSLGAIDQLTDLVRGDGALSPERVHALGSVLAKEAPRREAVKFGLALLGTIVGAEDDQLLLELGAHEEFTLFAAVALINQGRGDEVLCALARRVDGWGRIQVVERLAKTSNPEIKSWLLREGFRNSVMDEYLAHTCAVAGELHVALQAPDVDRELLRGAAGILTALANGGPAEDLADYEHADAAISAFVEQLERNPLDLELLAALDALSAREEVSAELKRRLTTLRAGPNVRSLIESGLTATDPNDFWRADQAARARGMDTFAHHERRVLAGELDVSLFSLLQAATAHTIARALTATRAQLPLEKVASGAADALGFGPEFVHHTHLDFVLQVLPRFPGHGVDFLLAGLKSPVIRNRNGAVRVLASWTPKRWSPELTASFAQAVAAEPDDDVRERMVRVQAGGAYEED